MQFLTHQLHPVMGGRSIRLGPKYQNHIWSIDFVHDKLANGRPYKMLAVLDEYSREAPCAWR